MTYPVMRFSPPSNLGSGIPLLDNPILTFFNENISHKSERRIIKLVCLSVSA